MSHASDNQVYCAHCKTKTTRYHERQHRNEVAAEEESRISRAGERTPLSKRRRVQSISSTTSPASTSQTSLKDRGSHDIASLPLPPTNLPRAGTPMSVDTDSDLDGDDADDDEPLRIYNAKDEESGDEIVEDEVVDGATVEDIIYEYVLKESQLNENDLDEDDKDLLRFYSMKVRHNLTDAWWRDAPSVFTKESIPSLEQARTRISELSRFKPVLFDCCINSCIAYTGKWANEHRCPNKKCNEPRRTPDGRPRKRFCYLPLIPRLTAAAQSLPEATRRQYRAQRQPSSTTISDIYDSLHYRELCARKVVADGKTLSHTFFCDLRDIPLGVSTDGFAPFRKRSSTCWPLIAFDYSLPPEIRTHIENILTLGVIPGPQKPWDMDSFLYPFVEEMVILAQGVTALDALTQRAFKLHAYVILVFGDIPAMSLVMRLKGHNGYSACRMCKITGVQQPGANGSAHYFPLDRSMHPSVLSSTDSAAVPIYDASALPMRTHAEILSQGKHVEAATAAEAKHLATLYGVKGVPLLSRLSSLDLARSCPYDFMHLIWENLIKNLILLWTGEFKGLNEGSGCYVIDAKVWNAIAEASHESGKTIPGCYGARPPNFRTQKQAMSADAWSFWTLYLGPALLQRQFSDEKYYWHFVRLVKLLHICLQFELTMDDITTIREGFIAWVTEYEEFYYQYDSARVSTCPLTVHALLHIADCIVYCGPIWTYWAFPMERYCGIIRPFIRSRKAPYASLDRAVLETAQLFQTGLLYGLQDHLNALHRRRNPKLPAGAVRIPGYSYTLLPPSRPVVSSSLIKKVLRALGTRYDLSSGHFPSGELKVDVLKRIVVGARITEYGAARVDDGDDLHAASMLTAAQATDGRDATFVRYEMVVDRLAHQRGRSRNEHITFYGRLQHILRVDLPIEPAAGLTKPITLVLALINQCELIAHHDILDIHYYKTEVAAMEPVDLDCLMCLVGRVRLIQDPRIWAIFDRSGPIARAVWTGED